MITQEIPISLLMEPQKNLIFRKGDFGNQIKINFPDLTGITSAEFRLIKPDDTFIVSSGEIIENDILITITEQMSVKSGLCIFNLRLINDSSNIYTYVGRALIDDNINLDDYAESVAEVNGLIFPDDFLTETDLSQYATKAYVNTAIAEIPKFTPISYSLEEQNTGIKWVDGKPIYQKTFIITQNDTWEDLTSLNIDNCIEQKGTFNSTSGACLAFNVNPVSDYYAVIDMELINNRFRVYISGWTLATARVTLQYTKTTDTV